MDNNILETNFGKAKTWVNSGFIDEDILVLDRLNEVPMPTEPRRMNFILIALCTKGSIRYNMDTKEQHVKPGDVIIVSEHHVIDGYQASPDLEGMCMILSTGFFQDIIQNVSDVSTLFLFSHMHPVMHLSSDEVKTFSDYFDVIRRKVKDTTNQFRRNLVRALLLALFYDLSNVISRDREVSDKRLTRADEIFTKFLKMVESNYKRERRVGWYAEQLSITPKYLSETVKHVSKRTPNEWIDQYVVLELRIMLKTSTLSIKEIAKEMSFPNQSFLGKYFKEHVGMSPNAYRKSAF